VEADGDMRKSRGAYFGKRIAKAAKKADRVASEGTGPNCFLRRMGPLELIIEVNSETDFVWPRSGNLWTSLDALARKFWNGQMEKPKVSLHGFWMGDSAGSPSRQDLRELEENMNIRRFHRDASEGCNM
jgi:elongation factor Ts